MGDAADGFKDLRDHKTALRAKYGVNCPQCAKVRPKANPARLMPQQRCKVDGYIDTRPELTDEEWSNP